MIFLADFPPPVHGMSLINLAALRLLKKYRMKFVVINTAPNSDRIPRWLAKLFLFSLSCLKLIYHSIWVASHNSRVLYRPINGGYGQVYDIVYIIIARVFRLKIIIHHHSFYYLNKKFFLSKLLFFVAGGGAFHIALGREMNDALKSLYGISNNKIFSISNVAFFEKSVLSSKCESDQVRIGHLSNLTREKGLHIFLDVCRLFTDAGIPYRAFLAGPVSNSGDIATIEKACAEMQSLSYMGPLYDKEKLDFYNDIDVFIFPSQYKNEAEPLVIYEAARSGLIVVATDVGCNASVLAKLGGFCIDFSDDVECATSIFNVINDEREVDHGQLARVKRVEAYNRSVADARKELLTLVREVQYAKTR